MAKKVKFDASFNFGANRKPKVPKGRKGKGSKGNAWRGYTTGGKKR